MKCGDMEDKALTRISFMLDTLRCSGQAHLLVWILIGRTAGFLGKMTAAFHSASHDLKLF